MPIDTLNPPQCLAVSAKRYVLFNRTDGSLVIRKASGHGLGDLLAPYDEPPLDRRARIKQIGVPLWQENVWKEVIRAADTGTPDQTRFIDMPLFEFLPPANMRLRRRSFSPGSKATTRVIPRGRGYFRSGSCYRCRPSLG